MTRQRIATVDADNSVRPEFKGRKALAFLELIRLLVSHANFGHGNMSRNQALTIFLVKTAGPFVQALFKEVQRKVSPDVVESIRSLAEAARIDLDGNDQVTAFANLINPSPNTALTSDPASSPGTRFMDALKDVPDDDWG